MIVIIQEMNRLCQVFQLQLQVSKKRIISSHHRSVAVGEMLIRLRKCFQSATEDPLCVARANGVERSSGCQSALQT